jgi:hypothetical protein
MFDARPGIVGPLTPSLLATLRSSPGPPPTGEGRLFLNRRTFMALYRCHFLDALDNVNAQEEIDAGSLLDAVERATAMLDRRSDHDAVEIWAGNRWICRAGRERVYAEHPFWRELLN